MIRRRHRFIAPLVILAGLATSLAVPAGADTASEILGMTGARTRIVWAHQVKGESRHWGSGSPDFALFGFDTTTGKADVILPGPASFGNPSITPDGGRVVYTDVGAGNMICVVDWDGRNKKKLKPGYALCAWVDPATGIQWVYAAKAEFTSPIVRFQLDNPETAETVWDKACGPTSGFQVSADGTRAGCVRNHPNAGTIYFNEDRHASHGWGCEAGFAPDNSYRFFHMGEWVEHGGVNMYDADGANKRTVHFGKFPGSPGYDAWNPRWSTDVRFMTVSSPNAGMAQDVYFGAFDAEITRIDKWVRISDAHGHDLASHAWIDPGIGTRAGEAPFTVAVPAPGGGSWTWDHGDGTTSTGAVARHTYEEPGTYALVGRRDQQVVQGTVVVAPNAAPQVVATGLRDESTLTVWFDEPISLDQASSTFKSGTTVESVRPGRTDFELDLKLSGPLPKRDALTLTGVFDRAANRNPAAGSIKIQRTNWPVDRANLLWLWAKDERQRFHFDGRAARFLATRLARDRIARIGANGELILRGGTFAAKGAGPAITVACRSRHAFTLEAMITPYSGTQGSTNEPRRIISCNAGPGMNQVNFALCQQASTLVLYAYTKPAGEKAAVRVGEIGDLEPHQPNHIVVACEPGRISAYRNGEPADAPLDWHGELPWRDVSYHSGLSVGGHPGEATTWWGEVSHIAVYSRALDRREAASHHKASRKALAFKAPPPPVRLRATLVAKSRLPSPAEIAPYVDALTINEYETVETLSGKPAPTRVRVAQWGLVNKAVQPIAELAPGTEVELWLEPFDHHPELANDPLRDTLDEDFDMELYFDVTVPAERTTGGDP